MTGDGSSLERVASEDDPEGASTEIGVQPPLDGPTGVFSPALLHRSHSGPLPSPESLQGYKDVDPSLVPTILDMAQREQSHRHPIDDHIIELERQEQTARRHAISRGQWLGFGIAVLVLGLAGLMAVLGYEQIALALAAVNIAALAAVFVSSGVRERNRRSEPTAEGTEEQPADQD